MNPKDQQTQLKNLHRSNLSGFIDEGLVFVGGLSLRTTEADVIDYMTRFGQVEFFRLEILNGVSRGFGFVKFQNPETSKQVQSMVHTIDSRQITTNQYVHQQDVWSKITDQTNRKIFLLGITPSLNQRDLMQYFIQYGEVESIIINQFPDGRMKGTGFVIFKQKQSADYLTETSLKFHNINGKKVKIYKCLTKNAITKYKQSNNKKAINSLSPISKLSYSKEELLKISGLQKAKHKDDSPYNNSIHSLTPNQGLHLKSEQLQDSFNSRYCGDQGLVSISQTEHLNSKIISRRVRSAQSLLLNSRHQDLSNVRFNIQPNRRF